MKVQLLALCIVFSARFPLQALPFAGMDLQGSVGGGFLANGSFEASWHDDFPTEYTVKANTDPSWMFRAGLDARLQPSLAIGLLAIYAAIAPTADIAWVDGGVSYRVARDDIRVFDVGLGPVWRLFPGSRLSFRCGLYGGCRWSFSSVPEAREFAMALDGNIAAEYRLRDRVSVFLEGGFLGQPYGGVQGVAFVRGGPIFYAAAGASFE